MDIISFGLASKVNKAIKDLIGDSKLTIPSGTTAERPVLLAGDKAVRFNTDTNGLEEWNGIEWKNVSAKISAVNIKDSDTESNILAMTSMVSGDLWIASDTLDGWVYNGSSWLNIGPLQGPQGIQGIQGIQGDTGNGIASIVKTDTVGLVDTYTVTMTSGTTATFTVTNGLDGADGTDVDHIAQTSGTRAPGTVDVYTVWGDLAETVNLGTFEVYNGRDGSGQVFSVAGKIGDVILTEADITDLDKYTQSEVDEALALKADKVTYKEMVSTTTLEPGKVYIATEVLSAYSLSLPASPAQFSIIELLIDTSDIISNNITILRNGSTINNIADDLLFTNDGEYVKMIYINGDWSILNG